MLRLALQKITSALLVILGVVCVVFFLFNILPGDPARMMLGQRADISSVKVIEKELGRDLPPGKQFLLYLNDLSPLSVLNVSDSASRIFADKVKYGSLVKVLPLNNKGLYFKQPYLRRSYQSQQRVTEVLLDALPGTVILSAAALLFAAITGIVLGTWSALHFQSWPDRLSLVISVLGMSLPSFFAGILMAWLFGFVLSDWTGLEMTGSLYEVDPFKGVYIEWKNLVLPALTLGIRPLSVVVQLTRSSMLDVLSMDFVRTARAKGLSSRMVIYKHALRNALNPVLTALSGWLGSMLAGAVFIEYIFGWKGIGKLTVDALEHYDFPVVMGSVLLASVLFVLINMLVDVLYSVLDPRVRLEAS